MLDIDCANLREETRSNVLTLDALLGFSSHRSKCLNPPAVIEHPASCSLPKATPPSLHYPEWRGG